MCGGPESGCFSWRESRAKSFVRLLPWDRSLRASSPSRWQHPGIRGLGKALKPQYCSWPQDVQATAHSCPGLRGHLEEQIVCALFFQLPRLTAHRPGDLAGRSPHCLCVPPGPRPVTLDDCFWFCSVGDVERAMFLTSPSLQYAGSARRPLAK